VARRGPPIDGRSLMPLLRGESSGWTDRTLFTQWHRGDEPEPFRDCAVRTQQYKLINGQELYDMASDAAESKDISASNPETVSRLRNAYEKWFRDVSGARGYAPPRIPLGTRYENPVILTRQDWRGPQAGWNQGSLGYWEVEVATPGKYEITLRVAPAAQDSRVRFRLGGVEQTGEVKAGERVCRLDPVALERGPGRLEAEIAAGEGKRGVEYVEARML
jgi:hypothetical protein